MRSVLSRSSRSLAAAVLLAGACAPPAHALLYHLPEGFYTGLYGAVDVDYEPEDGPQQNVSDARLDPSPVTYGQFVLSVANEAGFNSAATVVGQVGYGFARLDAIAIARVHGEGRSDADVHAGAAFSDVITISAPGLNGTTGSMLLGVFVDGALSTANGGNNAAVSSYAFGGAVAYAGGGREVLVQSPGFGDINPAETLDEEFLGDVVSFVFGQPFPFFFRLEVEGEATASVSEPGHGVVATFVGDFGHTMTWAGVLDLRDASGTPVVDFDVTSDSGTNYRDRIVPVPEAGSALPVLAGLAVLAWRRR